MKETMIIEIEKVKLKSPILIEGLPGLGTVGKIVTDYLRRKMRAKKFAELYSPHFAYYVLVDKTGSIRLLRNEFYYWRNEGGENDIIILTGDSQAQTIEGQYEIASHILDFAESMGVELIITVGGYRDKVKGEPKVIAASTNPSILERAMKAGADGSSSGNPIVGMAGLLLGLAKLRDMDALCLLGETLGHIPDPKAAKSVLKVLMKLLGFEIDLSELEKEIARSEEIMEKVRELEAQRKLALKKRRRLEEERIIYIS